MTTTQAAGSLSGAAPARPTSVRPVVLIAGGLLLLIALAIAGFAIFRLGAGVFKRPLPIALTYRPAITGRSLVAQFHNLSGRYLEVDATFASDTLQQTHHVFIQMGPYQTVEYGWLEGWSFMSGEHITLRHADYRILKATVP